MNRLNFIFRFLNKTKIDSSQIQVYQVTRKKSTSRNLEQELINYDRRIIEIMKNLIQVQMVKMRATVSQPNNWFSSIYKNAYKTSIQSSIDWHLSELREVLKQKQSAQKEYSRLNSGSLKIRFRKWIAGLIAIVGIICFIFIFILGLIALIYSLPLMILLIIITLGLNRRNLN